MAGMAGQDLTVKARYEADVSSYTASMKAAATATDRLATSADKTGQATAKAGQAAERASGRVAAAAEKAAQAQKRAEDAAGRLAVANARLDAARDSGNTTRLVSAEEAVARAQRDVEATARQAADAHQAYEAAAEQAAQAAGQLSDKVEQANTRTGALAQGVRDHSADLETVGQSLTVAGAGLSAMAGGATKAAMDWESAWAGVTKTVDGTDTEMAALEESLRGLATTLLTTHQEIAAVAESAGQLGVAREDVAGFTKTMIDLGETTNLTAEEAGTQIAQISNVMGTMEREGSEGVARFGAALVALGNDGASTEADILSMAQRISGAGATVGATETDVLALSNTLSSMGVKAELGGGVTTRVLLKMKKAVESGGESLAAFADVAGVSSDEFAKTFGSSPVEALNMVAQGIDRVNESGGATTQTLESLGMKGTEEAQVMLSLANSGDLLTESLELGAKAWEENTALLAEAEKRYQTAESQIKTAWNQIKDVAIDVGAAVLPVVAEIAEGAAGLAQAFGGLPDPVKGGLGALAGVGGIALTAAGGFMMLAPRVLESVDAFNRLAPAGSKARGALAGLGKASAVATGLSMLAAAAVEIHNAAQPSAISLEGMGNALNGIDGSNLESLNQAFNFEDISNGSFAVSGLADALALIDADTPAEQINAFGDSVLGIDNQSSRAKDALTQLDRALANIPADQAAEKMNTLRLEMEAQGRMDFSSWESLKSLMPEYTASVEAAAQATGKHTTEAELFQAAMGNLPPHMQAAKDAATQTEEGIAGLGTAAAEAENNLGALGEIDTTGMQGVEEAIGALSDETLELDERLSSVMDALFRLGVMNQTAAEATSAYQAALDGINTALEENGATLDITTEAGRANQDALFGIADAGRQLVQANAEAGASQGELRDQLQGTYDDLVAAGEQMGLTSEDAVQLARDVLGIPGNVDVSTWMDANALTMAEATTGAVESIPGHRAVSVAVSEDGTAGSVQAKIDELTGQVESHVFVTDDGTTTEVQQQIQNIAGVERTVWVDDAGTVYATQAEIDAVTGKDVTAMMHAETAQAEADLNMTARPRSAAFNGLAIFDHVEAEANNTARTRQAPIEGVPLMGEAEAAANHTARDRTSILTGEAVTGVANAALDAVAAPRTVRFVAELVGNAWNSARSAFGLQHGGIARHADGGIAQAGHTAMSLPGFSSGGMLPRTGLGTDMILGVTGSGMPIARVDDGEWIINAASSRRFHGVLAAINRDDPRVRHLAGFAGGGQPGRQWTPANHAAPQVTVQPGPGVDTAAIAGAVRAAMSGWQPVVKLGTYEVAGVMREAADYTRGR